MMFVIVAFIIAAKSGIVQGFLHGDLWLLNRFFERAFFPLCFLVFAFVLLCDRALCYVILLQMNANLKGRPYAR